ncbi:unnamed protein product [Vitrella brassicaformis CCMP3155]|uniref:Uncharacterized protein n=3 Tax=Vitrella brassicaformis TaxID=1169539 RepID=A0A0G4EU31_VITBC|nr:unnamed protein product [Vitrella brassicaformis CCMP3155]|eukprot:CEM01583.1 unnamed protein product [Vitrella brassicaformis CCMP3155]
MEEALDVPPYSPDGLRPAAYFFKFLARESILGKAAVDSAAKRKAQEAEATGQMTLTGLKGTALQAAEGREAWIMANRLYVWIPDTIVFNDVGRQGGMEQPPPRWYYSNTSGQLTYSTKFNLETILSNLSRGTSGPTAPIAVVKKIAKSATTFPKGCASQLMTVHQLSNFLQGVKGATDLTICVQKFIPPHGRKATLLRCNWRRELPPQGWYLTNGYSLSERRVPPSARLLVSLNPIKEVAQKTSTVGEAGEGAGGDERRKVAEKKVEVTPAYTAALQEPTKILQRIADYVGRVCGLRFDELMGDFIKDSAKQLWLIQVKAFRLVASPYTQPSIACEDSAMLEEEDYHAAGDREGREGGRGKGIPGDRSEPLQWRCGFCKCEYRLDKLAYRLTPSMVLRSQDLLRHMGRPLSWYEEELQSASRLSEKEIYRMQRACQACYRLHSALQELEEVELLFHTRLGLPIPRTPQHSGPPPQLSPRRRQQHQAAAAAPQQPGSSCLSLPAAVAVGPLTYTEIMAHHPALRGGWRDRDRDTPQEMDHDADTEAAPARAVHIRTREDIEGGDSVAKRQRRKDQQQRGGGGGGKRERRVLGWVSGGLARSYRGLVEGRGRHTQMHSDGLFPSAAISSGWEKDLNLPDLITATHAATQPHTQAPSAAAAAAAVGRPSFSLSPGLSPMSAEAPDSPKALMRRMMSDMRLAKEKDGPRGSADSGDSRVADIVAGGRRGSVAVGGGGGGGGAQLMSVVVNRGVTSEAGSTARMMMRYRLFILLQELRSVPAEYIATLKARRQCTLQFRLFGLTHIVPLTHHAPVLHSQDQQQTDQRREGDKEGEKEGGGEGEGERRRTIGRSDVLGTQPVNCMRIAYFFSQNPKRLMTFVHKMKSLNVTFCWRNQRLGTCSLALQPCWRKSISRQNILHPFTGTPSNLATLQLKAVVGATSGVIENVQPLSVKLYRGVFVPSPSYTAPEPLPPVWLEILSQHTTTTATGNKSSAADSSTGQPQQQQDEGKGDREDEYGAFIRQESDSDVSSDDGDGEDAVLTRGEGEGEGDAVHMATAAPLLSVYESHPYNRDTHIEAGMDLLRHIEETGKGR